MSDVVWILYVEGYNTKYEEGEVRMKDWDIQGVIDEAKKEEREWILALMDDFIVYDGNVQKYKEELKRRINKE